MKYQLDKWQKDVLQCKGNIVVRSGRQVGKSFIIGLKAAKYSSENRNKTVMIISKSERQAHLLFSKVLYFLKDISPKIIKKGRNNPTKQKVELVNGTTIYCLPCGETGYTIMGYTIDLLIADEAAWIPEAVFNSVIPGMAITKGDIWLLSTPFIKEGYFYEATKDPTFTEFHTTSEECPRKDVEFLKHKKETLTKAQYAQMYLGQFIDEIKRLFPEELVQRVCTLEKAPPKGRGRSYYLGCDVARYEDEFTYEVLERTDENYLIHIYNEHTRNIPLTQSARKIISLDQAYDFVKIYVDSAGMGIGVCDILRENEETKRKVVEINNANRAYNRTGGHKTILKTDLYMNLLRLMEQGKITLLDSEAVKDSLRSIQKEHNPETGRVLISGRYSHITEGIIRAAWCVNDGSNKLWCY